MAWTRVPRLRAKSVAASPPAAWTNQSSGDFCTVSTFDGETYTVPPGGTTGSVRGQRRQPPPASGMRPGHRRFRGGQGAQHAGGLGGLGRPGVQLGVLAQFRHEGPQGHRPLHRGEAAPVLVRLQRRHVVQERGRLLVLRGHGRADQHLPGPRHRGGEAPELVIADFPQPAERVQLQGVLHAVLDGVGEQGAAQQLAAEPGVGPHAFLQPRHDHHRPFPSGGAGRGHEFHGVLQLRPARPGCPWAVPGSAGIRGTARGPEPGSWSTKRSAVWNRAIMASRSRSARAPADPPARADSVQRAARPVECQRAQSTVSALPPGACGSVPAGLDHPGNPARRVPLDAQRGQRPGLQQRLDEERVAGASAAAQELLAAQRLPEPAQFNRGGAADPRRQQRHGRLRASARPGPAPRRRRPAAAGRRPRRGRRIRPPESGPGSPGRRGSAAAG